MGIESRIGWTHSTFNPVRGCRYASLDGAASPACTSCYAEGMSARNPAVLGEWGPTGRRAFASEPYWRGPVKWNADAVKAGERRRVFCASLADIFEGADVDGVESRWAVRPDYDPMLARLFALVEATPMLDWLLLTKRPHIMVAYAAGRRWPTNAWAGTTVENQAAANERIPHLLRVPAKVRFLSCEPLLGPIDLRNIRDCSETEKGWFNAITGRGGVYSHRPDTRSRFDDCDYDTERGGISWVISGVESNGPRLGDRRTDPAWTRSLRDQCVAAGVPYFLKQGDVGGRLVHAPELDGKAWQEIPNV